MIRPVKYFAGLDPSLVGTAVVMIDENSIIAEQRLVITDSKEDIESRLLRIVREVSFLRCVPTLETVCIEGLAYLSHSSRLFELAGIHFMLRCKMKECNIPFSVVPPTSLKKFATGKGNCGKDLIIKCVYEKWGVNFQNDNLADAYVLARMALEDFKDERK